MDKKTLIDELKFLIFYLFLTFCGTYFIFGVLGKTNWVPLFIFCCILYLFYLVWHFYLQDHMLAWRSKDKKSETSIIILALIFIPVYLVFGFAVAMVSGVPFGVSMALTGTYPSVIMFLRRKGLEDFFESSSDPSFLVWYWALGMLLCFPVIYPGFFYFTGTTESWIFLILTLILGLLVSTVMLSPDKVDRLVPADMTKGNGVFLMLAIGIGVIYASFCVMGLLNPNFRMW